MNKIFTEEEGETVSIIQPHNLSIGLITFTKKQRNSATCLIRTTKCLPWTVLIRQVSWLDKVHKQHSKLKRLGLAVPIEQVSSSVMASCTCTHACINLIGCKFKSLKCIPECLFWCCGFHIRIQIEPIMRPLYMRLFRTMSFWNFGIFKVSCIESCNYMYSQQLDIQTCQVRAQEDCDLRNYA